MLWLCSNVCCIWQWDVLCRQDRRRDVVCFMRLGEGEAEAGEASDG